MKKFSYQRKGNPGSFNKGLEKRNHQFMDETRIVVIFGEEVVTLDAEMGYFS